MNGSDGCNCPPGCTNRRDFLQMLGVAGLTASLPASVWAQVANGNPPALLDLIRKDFPVGWKESLFARGDRTVYTGADLKFIGMPIGGLCAGQMYLGGDGHLWNWDIFNRLYNSGCGGPHYSRPMASDSKIDQGFALRMRWNGREEIAPLNQAGFPDVSFEGKYPIGLVRYEDARYPVKAQLEAFSPFIPLDTDNSSLPATFFHFTLTNSSAGPVEVDIAGWLDNQVGMQSSKPGPLIRINTVHSMPEGLLMKAGAQIDGTKDAARPPLVLSGFNSRIESFGTAKGSLLSPEFTIERHFIYFQTGSNDVPTQQQTQLLIDGAVVMSAPLATKMESIDWDVRKYAGKRAQIRIINESPSGWPIYFDQVEFLDTPRQPGHHDDPLPALSDMGEMGLMLFGSEESDTAQAALSGEDGSPEAVFAQLKKKSPDNVSVPSSPTPLPNPGNFRGALGRTLKLNPGESRTVAFAVLWHFPNLLLAGARFTQGRYYATQFPALTDVAEHLAKNLSSLIEQTKLWNDTWYDSTLPYWFLDRTFANIGTLATSTTYRFADGRFWAWEGVGSCPGTCTHVYAYAQAAGRLFPDLEMNLRERTDFGYAQNEKTGVINFRGTSRGWAVDGQAGIILRMYRGYQMSADDAALRKLWPRIRLAMQALIDLDVNKDGILTGPQHNTLDAEWYGPVAWLSGMYQASLRAAEEMANDVGDHEFAELTRQILDKGAPKLANDLWGGEYFINLTDPKFAKTINSGTGCEIDQVFGQSWAFQVGLGRIFPEDKTVRALKSLWKYNVTTDVGPFRAVNKPGRWYALPGEGGLLMCTFPRPDWNFEKASGGRKSGFAGYFDECMSGFEHQVAAHMIWEGMVEEGLSVERLIHERYAASKRNPWNEIECGDHYGRAMASYGVFLAACGYEYHGPKGHLGFAPKLTPENFRAPFTSSEGWGTFSQQIANGHHSAGIDIKWGRLKLKTLALTLAPGGVATTVHALLDGQTVPVIHKVTSGRLTLSFATGIRIDKNQQLTVQIS